MRFTTVKTIAAAACSVALLGVVGCSSDDSPSSASEGTASQETPTTSDGMNDDMSDGSGADMAAQLVGPGCEAYAEQVPDGPGSVSGMAEDPVAVAASNNPLLTTLVAAVSGKVNPKVNLVDTLNGGEFTVFAPVDDAFAKIPPATLNMLKKPAAAGTLTKILTYHVLEGQIAPDAIVGSHPTVEGDELEVTGSGDDLMVNGANVVCGGVTTANATVYLIDGVLTPPSMG